MAQTHYIQIYFLFGEYLGKSILLYFYFKKIEDEKRLLLIIGFNILNIL